MAWPGCRLPDQWWFATEGRRLIGGPRLFVAGRNARKSFSSSGRNQSDLTCVKDVVGPYTPCFQIMFLLRFFFRSALVWAVTLLFGRFMPILRRVLRLIGW